jgi:hypothetical protein
VCVQGGLIGTSEEVVDLAEVKPEALYDSHAAAFWLTAWLFNNLFITIMNKAHFFFDSLYTPVAPSLHHHINLFNHHHERASCLLYHHCTLVCTLLAPSLRPSCILSRPCLLPFYINLSHDCTF